MASQRRDQEQASEERKLLEAAHIPIAGPDDPDPADRATVVAPKPAQVDLATIAGADGCL